MSGAQKSPPSGEQTGQGKAKGWQIQNDAPYRIRTRMTAGMAASFSASFASTAPVASSMV